MIDYLAIIKKYINPESGLFPIYMIHVTLVTAKALKVAKKLNLSNNDLQFIEEASMLHDIGIVNVNFPKIYCTGEANYLEHGYLGREILEAEDLPLHALVCERHTGTGIFLTEILAHSLPLPKRDMLATNLLEEIISYADLFYSKDPRVGLMNEQTVEMIVHDLSKYDKRHLDLFWVWHNKFNTEEET